MERVVLVVDLDGTLIDNKSRFEEFISSNGSFDMLSLREFFSEENVLSDPFMQGSEVVFELADKLNADIYFLTGRSEGFKDQTQKMLKKYKEEMGIEHDVKNIPLYMRPNESGPVKSYIVKEKILLRQLLPKHPGANFIFFEDEEENIKMFKQYGMVFESPECWPRIKELVNYHAPRGAACKSHS